MTTVIIFWAFYEQVVDATSQAIKSPIGPISLVGTSDCDFYSEGCYRQLQLPNLLAHPIEGAVSSEVTQLLLFLIHIETAGPAAIG